MKAHGLFTCIFLLAGFFASAQKYALIDQTLSHPVRYMNEITAHDIREKVIPVEKKYLPEFLKALQIIKRELDNNPKEPKARNFQFGCTQITGMVAALARETRYNYVIKSDCDNLHTSFLICDVKLKNSLNSFIVGTWIKYLKANMRK